MSLKKAILAILLSIICDQYNVLANDCWDPEKLNRMKFTKANGEEADPGLSQFAKMMQCLQAQSSGGAIGTNWNQAPGGSGGGRSFIPNWKVHNPSTVNDNNDWSRPGLNNNPNNPKYGGGSSSSGPDSWSKRERDRLNNPNSGYGPVGGVGQQPQPGVHPDDWGRIKTGVVGGGGSSEPAWTRRGKPADPPPGWAKDSHNRNDENRRRIVSSSSGVDGNQQQSMLNPYNNNNNGMNSGVGGSPRNPMDFGDPMGRDYVMMEEETAAVSLSRKYGYAIMALSVVVLAVLMVATIFCCNSSNSTMSQAANQTLAIPANGDNYSIYSYKGGVIGGGMDTMRSTGTLGGMSLHTETMKSSKSRASPQYRVSDIDPDFARRYDKESHHQY